MIQCERLRFLNSIFTVALISGYKACFDFSSSKFENNWLCLYNYTGKKLLVNTVPLRLLV